MNNLKKIISAMLLSAIALVHFDGFAKKSGPVTESMQQDKETRVATEADVDAVINAQTAQVKQVTAEAERIKMEATKAIEVAQEKRDKGEISRAQLAVIIGEQKYAIRQADETLEHVVEQSARKVEEAEGVLGRFVSGVKSWYYGPEEEREVAKARIAQLEEDLLATEDEYAGLIKNARGNRKKSGLRAELDTIKQDFKDEIGKQKDIAEGRMSSQKFWRAVSIAGAAVGGAVAYGAYRYFGGEDVPPAPVTGTLTLKAEEQTKKYDVPPTIEDIKKKGAALIETTGKRATELGETIKGKARDLRKQLPTSAERQIELGEGKVEQLRAKVARKEAAAEQAELEAARLKEARERNEAEIADRQRLRRETGKTTGQIKIEAAKTPEQIKKQEFSRSGLRGMIEKRAEDKQVAAKRQEVNAELASTNNFIQELEANKPQAETWAATQQAQLDTLRTEKEGLTGSALTRKSRAIVEQEIKANKANESLNYINTQLESSRAKAADLQQQLGK